MVRVDLGAIRARDGKKGVRLYFVVAKIGCRHNVLPKNQICAVRC